MSRFAPGAVVRVLDRPAAGHVRVPRYIRRRTGVVLECLGAFLDPEQLAFGNSAGPAVPLYRVCFRQQAIWPDYQGAPEDSVCIELPQHWLTEEFPP